MHKYIKALCLTFVLSVGAFAQDATNEKEYKKNEFYAGYSNQQVDLGSRRAYNGFDVAYVRNVHRYFGIKADVSSAYRSSDFNISASDPGTGSYSYRRRKQPFRL